jgi:hypothetical protein
MTIKYAAALLLACGLHAQSDSISINGSELRIGMPKSDVFTLLAERSNLVKMKGIDDAWCVRLKDDHPVQSGCGTFIQFGRDKLVVVSKAMGSANGDDAAAMMATLFSTLDGLAKAGKTDLAFSTEEIETDDHIRLRMISFFSGPKRYTFTAQQPVGSQSAGGSSVDLTESFALPSDRKK